MRHSNAFVLASRTETFGVVYIEALSQGLPVIATRCGGPESIVTSDNGLLVPIENIPELTKALLTLYKTMPTTIPSVCAKIACNNSAAVPLRNT